MTSNYMLKLLILLASLLASLPSTARAEIVRCKGETTFAGFTFPIRIDVVLPEVRNLWVLLSDREGKTIENVTGGWPVGNGTIEVKYGDKEPSRHSFVMTRRPDQLNSLVGFYLVNSYAMVLRADLWEKGKPFTFYDSYANELIRGRCE